MRKVIIFMFLLFCFQFVQAQKTKYDSLKNVLASSKDDSSRFYNLRQLYYNYIFSFPDSALTFWQQEFNLASRNNDVKALTIAYNDYGWFYLIIGDYPQALNYFQLALKLAEQNDDQLSVADAYDNMAVVYQEIGDLEKAKNCSEKSISVVESILSHDRLIQYYGYYTKLFSLATVYEEMNQLDSAFKYNQLADDGQYKISSQKWGPASFEFGNIYFKMGKYEIALIHYHTSLSISSALDIKKDIMDCYNGLAKTYKMLGVYDSSIFYANKVIELSRSTRYAISQLRALVLLSDIYETQKRSDSVAKYLRLTIAAKDSMFSRQKYYQIQNMTFDEQIRQQEAKNIQQQIQSKIRLYSVLATLVVFLTIALILFRNNRHKQKAYNLLKKQKNETDIQRIKVEQTLEELKTTQNSLIQSEKMASLGELTAGIAHEIQNPLNFVNNFSEVNQELLHEMKSEIDKGNLAEVKLIANDIIDNEEKISHHGKRADAIVKSMLQHSRVSGGQNEMTDINVLADEYLRLAYHGFKAKEKSFNCVIQTDFDSAISKINIIPQDIGRVLLNLYNNAFYALSAKSSAEALAKDEALVKSDISYEPLISVRTKKINEDIEISVMDNGNGIPEKVLEKVFQPFFTTKPTGQGTGLGLSISYDIIKAHHGNINIRNTAGEAVEFIITLPIIA